MIHNSVLEAIGDTPIVRLNKVAAGVKAHVYAKLEFANPGGSLKDRVGWWLIADAEHRGLLKPGGVVIEATGGNTGVGLAMAAAVKGYQCIFVVPEKVSDEKQKTLRAFGARVIVTPTGLLPDDPRSNYAVARRLADETPNAIYIDQYNNPANLDHHYRYTGPEILRQMPDIDALVAGIGTGGTVMGVGKFLKEHKPGVDIIAVDPIGSVIHDTFKYGESRSPSKSYLVEGIGKQWLPGIFDFKLIDDVVQVNDKESFLMTRKILTDEGIFAGASSGSAVVGALRWIADQGDRLDGKKVLVIFVDSGYRYISKVYDDDWMRKKGFLDADTGSVDR
jgi:cystathionine beta-synthase